MAVISLNSNVTALRAQRQLGQADNVWLTSLERLSTGLRINHASDDPAGLALASNLSVSSRVYGRAVLNGNDGISLLNIAQDSLGQLSSILTRLQELASQAANGVLSLNQRSALDTEASQLSAEYNRIVGSTSFNGRNVLDGSVSDLILQLGMGSKESLSSDVGDNLRRTSGTGSFQTSVSVAGGVVLSQCIADFNGDGKLDIYYYDGTFGDTMLTGKGDGTFNRSLISVGGVEPDEAVAGDVDNDGDVDILISSSTSNVVLLARNNGNGTFAAPTTISFVARSNLNLADINGDGKLDLIGNSGTTVYSYLGNGAGAFSLASSFAADTGLSKITTGDFNGDGKADIITGGSNTATVRLSNGSGSFTTAYTASVGASATVRSLAAGDINHDGKMDLVVGIDAQVETFLGNNDGTLQSATTINTGAGIQRAYLADINVDGNLDLVVGSAGDTKVSTFLNNGDGTFGARISKATANATNYLLIGDYNNDGIPDAASIDVSGSIKTLMSSTSNVWTVQRFDLTTASAARASLSLIDTALQKVESELGAIGATQSRLSIAVNSVMERRDNFLAAESRIQDADVASESAELLRSSILKQACQAVMAQANQIPALALPLLQTAKTAK